MQMTPKQVYEYAKGLRDENYKRNNNEQDCCI